MKKHLLLFFVALFAFALPGLAETITTTFDLVNDTYGINNTRGGSTYFSDETAVNGDVTIEFSKTSGNGFRFWSDGLRFYKGNVAFTVKANGNTITKVEITHAAAVGDVTFDNVKKSATKNGTLSFEPNAAEATFAYNITTNGAVSNVTVTYEKIGDTPVTGVAKPEISCESNTVTITAEEGTTVYYTLDGTEPTTASTVYTEPFTITRKTTVKAIAVKGDDTSAVATFNATVDTYTNFADFIADKATATVEGPLTAIYQNGRNLYLKDAQGGFILSYNSNNLEIPATVNGDVFASVTGAYKDQNGLPEIIPAAFGEKTEGTAVEPMVITVSQLSTDMLNAYVKIENVKIAAGARANNYDITDATGTAVLYNAFNSSYYDIIEVPEGEGYTIEGFVSVFSNTVQVTPCAITGGAPAEPVDYKPAFAEEGFAVEMTVGETLALELGETYPAEIAFDSDNAEVATIDENGVITAVGEGTTEIYVLWGDENFNEGEAEFTVTVKAKTTEKVDYKPAFAEEGFAVEMTVGETLALELGETYPAEIAFDSDNAEVATINENGVITAVAAGETTITVAWEADENFNEGEATFTVTVTKKEPVTTTTATVAFVASGASYEGTATTITSIENNTSGNCLNTDYTADNITIQFERKNTNSNSYVTGNLVRWYQNDLMHITPTEGTTITSVVVYASSNSYASAVSANNPDEVTVDGSTATWTGSTNKELVLTASKQVRFSAVEVTYTTGGTTVPDEPVDYKPAFAEEGFAVEMTVGETYTLDLGETYPADITFVTDDAIATISDNGVITAVAAGETIVLVEWAADENFTAGEAEFALTVKAKTTEKVDYKPAFAEEGFAVEMTVGETLALDLGEAYPAEIAFDSNNAEVATIDENGVITAVGEGETTITVAWEADDTYNEGEATFTVTVTNPAPVLNETATFLFKSTAKSDSSNAFSNDVAIDNVVENPETGLKFNAVKNTEYCYNGKSGYGMKVGKSGTGGVITFELSDKVYITEVVVNAARYSSTKTVNLKVNNTSAQDLTSADFDDYTYTLNEVTDLFTITSSTYCYVKSVTINYAPAPDAPEIDGVVDENGNAVTPGDYDAYNLNGGSLFIKIRVAEGHHIHHKFNADPIPAARAKYFADVVEDETPDNLTEDGYTKVEANEHTVEVNTNGKLHFYAYHPVTAAKSDEQRLVFTGDATTGVENIAVDEAGADAEYYTIQGVRVEADALTPGLYIVVKGDKATKVVVK